MKCCDRGKAWLMVCALFSSTAYGTIAPILPLEFHKRQINPLWKNPVFVVYSLGVILGAPCVPKMIPRVGKTNCLAIGLASMGVCLSCFGLIFFLESTSLILTFAIIIRFLQGGSAALIRTTCLAIATNDYLKEKEQVIGQIISMSGVGVIIGPFISSTLYSKTNFQATFFIIGTGFLTFSLIFRFSSPDMSSRKIVISEGFGEEDEGTEGMTPLVMSLHDVEEDQTERETEKVTIQNLMKSSRFSLALLGNTVCCFQWVFLEPILSQRLLEFHFSVFQIGLFFGIFSIFYLPSITICTRLIPNWIEKRVVIALSVLFCSISFFLIGPSQLLGFPNSVVMITFGWSLLGFSIAPLYVSILPELVDSTLSLFPGQEEMVNNLSSGLFNSFGGIGQVFGPLYGVTVSEWVGFRLTNDIAALLGIGFFALYFIFADVSEALKTSMSSRKNTFSRVEEPDVSALNRQSS